MAEYDLQFAVKLAKVADEVDEKEPDAYAARRVTIYLGRLAIEIALKALLEKAGVSVERIRRRSHDLRGLLKDLGECEVEVEVAAGHMQWVSASRVRSESLDLGFAKMPIGVVIDAEDEGGSKYPNEIRYGATIVDFDPTFVSGAAISLTEWAQDHWDRIRYAPLTSNRMLDGDTELVSV